MKIVDVLKKYRTFNGYSIKEMASLLEISVSYYNLITAEKKPLTENIINRFSVLLKCTPEELQTEPERIYEQIVFNQELAAAVSQKSFALADGQLTVFLKDGQTVSFKKCD